MTAIYHSILLWRWIKNQFGQELSVTARTLFGSRDADLDATMRQLTERLNLTLE